MNSVVSEIHYCGNSTHKYFKVNTCPPTDMLFEILGVNATILYNLGTYIRTVHKSRVEKYLSFSHFICNFLSTFFRYVNFTLLVTQLPSMQ